MRPIRITRCCAIRTFSVPRTNIRRKSCELLSNLLLKESSPKAWIKVFLGTEEQNDRLHERNLSTKKTSVKSMRTKDVQRSTQKGIASQSSSLFLCTRLQWRMGRDMRAYVPGNGYNLLSDTDLGKLNIERSHNISDTRYHAQLLTKGDGVRAGVNFCQDEERQE